MATVICNLNCKHRSKRKIRKMRYSTGEPCYGCTLKYVSISRIGDPDGDVYRTIGESEMARCAYYDPLDKEEEDGR